MNVQVSVTNVLASQRGQQANLLVLDANGNVFSKTMMTAGQPSDTTVASVVVPLGGSVSMSKFNPTPKYDSIQRAAVPGP